jgi:GNAT superfamily N-acetyltransferase
VRYTAALVDNLSITACRLSKISALRRLFLQELNAQCRYDAAHTRRGTGEYLARWNGRDIGYASVKDTGSDPTVFEFYIVPPFRADADAVLRATIAKAQPVALECQTNDPFYASLVQRSFGPPACDTILFAAGPSNELTSPDAVFRARRRTDRIFEHHVEPVGDFVIDVGGDVVGTGGFLLHYNPPFADLFMEVRADARRRGYGAFLIQGLIRESYLAGRVPAARTSTDNVASQRTLARGGLRECGRMLRVSAG